MFEYFYNIDNSFYVIKNYLINNEIIINDNDDIDVKIKLYLLKYRILIGLILLLLLIILGYYCNPYENLLNSNNSNNSESQIQRGGAGGLAGAVGAAGTALTKTVGAAAQTTPPPPPPPQDVPRPGRTRRALIRQGQNFAESRKKILNRPLGKAGSAIGKGAKAAYDDPKKYLNKGFDFGAAAAHKISDNSDLIYQILYSAALFVVICIIAIPSIAFLIIGIVCYFLLKDKMKTIKGL